MFRNASTVVFIANDPSYDLSQIDCGLLGENMILSAWSMGIGSCCLGGPTRFMTSTPAAAEYLKKLDIPEGYQLLYCIAFGYPDETPAAKPRNAAKVNSSIDFRLNDDNKRSASPFGRALLSYITTKLFCLSVLVCAFTLKLIEDNLTHTH